MDNLCLTLDLSGSWDLRDEILGLPLDAAARLTAEPEGWLAQPVPGDIHQGLLAAGRIQEPLLGLNSFDCQWTENRSWWFRRRFSVDEALLAAEVVELSADGLDANAELFLNGRHIGSHRNAFRPFVLDVKSWLQAGENVLLIRLTTGVETVSEAELDAPDGVRAGTEAGNGRPERGEPRRTFVRKPQYSFGWDWSPRVATTAIAGAVTLRGLNQAVLRRVNLVPRRDNDTDVTVRATLTVERFHFYQTADAEVALLLTDAAGRQFHARQAVLLRSGVNFIDLDVPVPDARLWWPNGLGEAHLYRVEAVLTVAGETTALPAFDWGLRFLELDTDGVFAVVVNGCRVFCKGANWIPADAIYARVTSDRYDELVRQAADANFTMLRIWGGGLYEPEAFYAACDRYGILLWHDFMFGCAPYPDHLDWFRREVELEAEYQTQRLQRHACLALWCGSNENNWGFHEWWGDRTKGGAYLYNHLLPTAVRRHCPEVPYWNGSPYGGAAPNSAEVGDRHHWWDCMMNPDMLKRITPEEYDQCQSLFVSEFGYIGPPAKETVLHYLDGAEPDRTSRVWHHHNNTFEKETVEAGIRKHYADPATLSFDEYLLYSGLCQGLMYGYALDSMRYRANCHGGLFWMFEDCWGEVGWTIVDSDLRRKIAWYFVRRTYAPVRLLLRAAGDAVRVVVANDTRQARPLTLEVGYLALDGSLADVQTVEVSAAALARTTVGDFARGGHDPRGGVWVARPVNAPDLWPGLFRAVDFRELRTSEPGLTATVSPAAGGYAVTVTAAAYAHGVHLDLPAGDVPSDDWFDLLPGESRTVTVQAQAVPVAVEVTAVR